MINLRFSVDVFEFDSVEYNKLMIQRIRDVFVEGARKFYTIAVSKIPIRTEFVVGAFKNLRDLLGKEFGPQDDPITLVKRILGPKQKTNRPVKETAAERITEKDVGRPGVESPQRRITREVIQKGKKRTVSIKNEFYYPPGLGRAGRVLKTPQSGRRFATPLDQIFVLKNSRIEFNFNVDISYFTIQDVANIGRSRSAPWNATNAGFVAFLKYVQNRIEARKFFPQITDVIVKTTYKVDYKGFTKQRTERFKSEILQLGK